MMAAAILLSVPTPKCKPSARASADSRARQALLVGVPVGVNHVAVLVTP